MERDPLLVSLLKKRQELAESVYRLELDCFCLGYTCERDGQGAFVITAPKVVSFECKCRVAHSLYYFEGNFSSDASWLANITEAEGKAKKITSSKIVLGHFSKLKDLAAIYKLRSVGYNIKEKFLT